MVICKITCPIFFKCEDCSEGQRCIYDLGFPEEKDEGDEFLDRYTY